MPGTLTCTIRIYILLVCILQCPSFGSDRREECGDATCGHRAKCQGGGCECKGTAGKMITLATNVQYCLQRCGNGDPCPVGTSCEADITGGFACQCDVGYQLTRYGACEEGTNQPTPDGDGSSSQGNKSTSNGNGGSTQDSTATYIGLGVGIPSFVLLVVIIVILVVVFRPRRISQRDAEPSLLRLEPTGREPVETTASLHHSITGLQLPTGGAEHAPSAPAGKESSAWPRALAYEIVDLYPNLLNEHNSTTGAACKVGYTEADKSKGREASEKQPAVDLYSNQTIPENKAIQKARTGIKAKLSPPTNGDRATAVNPTPRDQICDTPNESSTWNLPKPNPEGSNPYNTLYDLTRPLAPGSGQSDSLTDSNAHALLGVAKGQSVRDMERQ